MLLKKQQCIYVFDACSKFVAIEEAFSDLGNVTAIQAEDIAIQRTCERASNVRKTSKAS